MIRPNFEKGNGLVPVVVQDIHTKQVLMLAYMNEESFQKTLDTSLATYFSRSRNELWVKGETSGHYQHVKEMLIDCDEDTILLFVEQEGAACHTGHYSCFYRDINGDEINE
jgi:phosphoribosyl-AMP cyclohydrolase